MYNYIYKIFNNIFKIIYNIISMDDELNILRLFSENGFNKIIEQFDELLNNQDLFINFIILNLKTKENIKILCNFIKLDVLKYELLVITIPPSP